MVLSGKMMTTSKLFCDKRHLIMGANRERYRVWDPIEEVYHYASRCRQCALDHARSEGEKWMRRQEVKDWYREHTEGTSR